MFESVDLTLIGRQLAQLQSTPYFQEDLNGYVTGLRRVAARLLENPPPLSPLLTREMADHLWLALRYMMGSVSREIPYEVCCAVGLALQDWPQPQGRTPIVTTALLDEQSYHFQGVDPRFYVLASSYLGVDFSVRPLLMAMPRLYKHQPLLNVALYHELGHYVDQQIGVSTLAANITGAANALADVARLQRHYGEYFSDLFAASYTGGVIADALDHMAPNASASLTHPATIDRRRVVNGFLTGTPEPEEQLFNFILNALQRTPLQIKFELPTLTSTFGNMRPVSLTTHSQVHGLFPAAMSFFAQAKRGDFPAWSNLGETETVRFINDLVEKSIRNWLVQKKWQAGVAQP